MSPLVLVGAFSIEGDSFVPGETTLTDFQRQVWATGDEVTRDCCGSDSELAGAWDVLVAAGITPIGSVAARSSPGPRVARAVFEQVCQGILSRCTAGVDGVYLMLHGSALVIGEDDPEGWLLTEIRARVGPTVPIAISLDLHAYLTERMLASVDIVTVYRTCPHIDLYRTGEQAGRLLTRTLLGQISPVCRRVRLPMITPPERHDSAQDPFARLQAACTQAEQDGALAAGLLSTQPWLDVPELGWSAVVTTDDDPLAAEAAAERIADQAWQVREEFLHTTAIGCEQAVTEALAQPGVCTIADLGDATNGGSYGDSTELLRVLLDRQTSGQPAGPAALSVTDPVAAAAAWRAGVGSRVTLTVGTGAAGAFNEAVTVSAAVDRLWRGEIRYTHPAAYGLLDDPGDTAVLTVGEVTVIVHSRPVRVIDPAIYRAVGVDLAGLRIVQAKSHVSFRAGFEPVTDLSILADTRGPTAANLTTLPYANRPRPLFPFEDAKWPPAAKNR